MPRYEVEVTDHLGAWGYAGKWYRPGVYIVDDAALAEAARQQKGVRVIELADEEEAADVRYGEGGADVGPLTMTDLRTNPTPNTCETCGVTYKKQHRCRAPATVEEAPNDD